MVADSHRTKSLPPELECMIFETAALAHPTSIPSLILVARWVKHRVIETKPPGFLQNSVRYLHIDAPIKHSDLQTIGAPYSGVMNMFHYCTGIAMGPGALGGVQNLRFLTISLRQFLHCCSFTKVHSMLVNITHLELLETGNFRGEVLAAHLPLLPRLTHLALDSILLDVPFYEPTKHSRNVHLLLEDSRLVCVDQETDWRADWLHGVTTGENYWTTSEAFIAARRDKPFRWSAIVDTDTSWGD
ncbi:hypothetical protein B0H14DRAFT_3468866 [Mycena olivaceomarginata]|nr:hypothetical protein B0H14DRAFT_3468866 [Mycena olivaceomarginata]